MICFVEKKSTILLIIIYFVVYLEGAADTVAEAEPEVRVEIGEAEEGEKDGNENPDVLYEANVMQDQRILDDDDVIVYKSKSAGKGEELTAASAIVSNEKGESEWKVQKANRLKRRLEKIMRQELSKTEVMPRERAGTVRLWCLLNVLYYMVCSVRDKMNSAL